MKTKTQLKRLQAISDAEGSAQPRTLDKFTLYKPRGWRPTKAARASADSRLRHSTEEAARAAAAAWLAAAGASTARLWRHIVGVPAV